MNYRMRRKSMEQLELYDLDQIKPRYSKPPPLPPPRQQRQQPCQLPSDVAFQRYSFLCDMTRLQTDSNYASTPMFSVIPQQKKVRYHRQMLGTRFPANIVKPIASKSSKNADDDGEENEDDNETKSHPRKYEEESSEDEEEEEEESSEEFDDDGDDWSSSESSDNAGGGDDDNDKGIVEQIFNRDRK